jgi:signal transduction histidine kinase
VDQAFTDAEIRSALASNQPNMRVVDDAGTVRLLVPIYDGPSEELTAGERERLGWLFAVYRPDPGLLARMPRVEMPAVEPVDFMLPATLFLALVAVGSLFTAALSVWPVRGLERALADYRARGYRGGLKAGRLARRGELADTVRAITELGGRLEALAEHGQEREALLKTLSQSLEDGMVALGPDGAPLAWNPAALRVLGDDAEPGRSADPADASDDGSREQRLREALQRNPEVADPAARPVAPAQWEAELALPDGGMTPVRVTRVPLELHPGESGSLILLRDVAALRRVEDHLLEAGRYAVLAHLAASLAHEIRNPLHSIGLNAGVVEQYVQGDWSRAGARAVRDSLASIQEETRRLTDLLNNYLGLARPQDDRVPVDLRSLCVRVLRLMSYTAKQSGVHLRMGGDESVPTVSGSADRLQQAILNLVLNSIQAMPDGGTIELAAVSGPDRVDVLVTDDGPGVPADLRGRLFEIGVTTKSTGTGLGLPLVRLIVESHGGRVSYRALPQGGSEFGLSLPI